MILCKASKRMSGPWGGLKRARAEATNAGVLQVSGAAATGCCCPPLALAPHCTVMYSVSVDCHRHKLGDVQLFL